MGVWQSIHKVGSKFACLNSQIRQKHRGVLHFCAPGAGKLADAVDRVVIVEGQQKGTAWPKRIRLPNEFERAAGVGSEDYRIVIGWRTEVVKHCGTRLLYKVGRGKRGWIDGMRIAKHCAQQQAHMLLNL